MRETKPRRTRARSELVLRKTTVKNLTASTGIKAGAQCVETHWYPPCRNTCFNCKLSSQVG